MPYLGRELTSGNYLKLDDITSQFDGNDVTFEHEGSGSTYGNQHGSAIFTLLS